MPWMSGHNLAVVTAEDVRRFALTLPRTQEHLIRDRVKFKIGPIVYASLSRDETTMGFGYPKEERVGLVEAEPDKFFMPSKGDLRYNWVCAWLSALDETEMRELILDAWQMCVSKRVAAAFFAAQSTDP